MKIKFIKYRHDLLEPTRAHYNDAGLDCFIQDGGIVIYPHQTIKIPLGFGVKLPDGIMGTMITRSSKATEGLHSHMSPIDSGYTGEIQLIVTNLSTDKKIFKKGDKIGQLIFIPFLIAELVADTEEQVERGNSAFGSSYRQLDATKCKDNGEEYRRVVIDKGPFDPDKIGEFWPFDEEKEKEVRKCQEEKEQTTIRILDTI